MAAIISQPVSTPVEAELAEFPSAQTQPIPKFRRRLQMLAEFTVIQAVVQIIGFGAGLLIVRSLPKREYAYYTIGNTMLSTILYLADSGISSALSAIGGRVWQDHQRLSSLFNTALRLRRQLGAVTVVLVVPVLIWLLAQ